MNKKININILTPFKYPSFSRQIPSSILDEGYYGITENGPDSMYYDVVVVYEGIKKPSRITCKRGGLIFVSGEPPYSRRYSKKFLDQFDHVISSHPQIKHNKNHLTQQALPWHFGLSYKSKEFNFSFDDLVSLPLPDKTKKISIITSNKKMMPGHKKRMNFLGIYGKISGMK